MSVLPDTGSVPAEIPAARSKRAISKQGAARLRLYVARATPNSLRAERHLRAALDRLDAAERPDVEVIDVFLHSKRALVDGVIVTPTLIGITVHGRMTIIGDLTDGDKLQLLLLETVRKDG